MVNFVWLNVPVYRITMSTAFPTVSHSPRTLRNTETRYVQVICENQCVYIYARQTPNYRNSEPSSSTFPNRFKEAFFSPFPNLLYITGSLTYGMC